MIVLLPFAVGATDGLLPLQHLQREPPITPSYAFQGEKLRDLALRHVGKPISELAPDLESRERLGGEAHDPVGELEDVRSGRDRTLVRESNRGSCAA